MVVVDFFGCVHVFERYRLKCIEIELATVELATVIGESEGLVSLEGKLGDHFRKREMGYQCSPVKNEPRKHSLH